VADELLVDRHRRGIVTLITRGRNAREGQAALQAFLERTSHPRARTGD
jgi:hypothetical protein